MKKTSTALVLSAIICLSVVSGFALEYVTRQVSFTGQLRLIGDIQAYSDVACTVVITSFDYGGFDEGQTLSKQIYIKNIGNTATTVRWFIMDLNWAISTLGDSYEYNDGTLRWTVYTGINPDGIGWVLLPNEVLALNFALREEMAEVEVPIAYTLDIIASDT